MSDPGTGALLGTSSAADYVGGTPAPAANVVPIDQMTPEQAAARLEAAKADPKWREAFTKGDLKVTGEHAALFRVMYSGADQQTREAAQAREERSQLVNQYRQVADIPDDVAKQVVDNVAVSAAERERVDQLWQRLKSSDTWVKAWLSGDRTARTQKTLIDIVMARPVIQESSRS